MHLLLHVETGVSDVTMDTGDGVPVLLGPSINPTYKKKDH
jgi:hypothetical protein